MDTSLNLKTAVRHDDLFVQDLVWELAHLVFSALLFAPPSDRVDL